MDKLRELLRAEMVKRGLSGRKLAREVGIDFNVVNDFLAGKRNITKGTQALICQHLNLDWDWNQAPALKTPQETV